MVTLRDIAKKLGISHVSVSRVLHNSPLVSASLRKRVQAAAKSLDYHPNAMAVALGQRRYHTAVHPIKAELAWINFWRNPQELRSYREFDLYWKGACETAERLGYRLEEFICHDQITLPRLEKILLTRNISGILIPPHRMGDLPSDWHSLHWEKFSVVRFGYSVAYPKVSVAGGDYLIYGLLAFENIRRLGYRRIGYVYSRTTTGRAQAGFLMKQQELPPKDRIPVLILTDKKDQSIETPRLSAWIKRHRPDAILTDISAMHKMLRTAGYRVPRDIGLATTSVLDGGADAGIFQNSVEIGKAAVETLVALINYSQTGIPSLYRQVLIEASWVDGSSLPPRNIPA